MSYRVPAAVVAALVAVAFAVVPGRTATSDTYRSRQWGLDRISAETAWPIADGTGAVVAVVDTGVDRSHPDLVDKLDWYDDADIIEPKGTDGPLDANGHGTQVAGVVGAATGNGLGIAGVAPGARLLPVRVLNSRGEASSENVAAGIRYATTKGADVINLSLGVVSGVDQVAKILGDLDPVYDAIDAAWASGAVVVIAAGNDSFPLCAEPSAHPRALCVGATDRNDSPSYFSNRDARMSGRFVVAPGGDGITCSGDVLSTMWLGGRHGSCSPAKGYDSFAGTSTSTPFVSGVAALLAGVGLDNATIFQRILATADDLGLPGTDPVFGNGRVNAARAVGAAT